MLKLTISVPPKADFIEHPEILLDAWRGGLEVLIKRHLLERNRSRPSRAPMPKSSYYADAASAVTSAIVGSAAEVTIDHAGIALHYYGGIVLPTNGRKALAIPKNPAVHDAKPSEIDPSRKLLALIWPKGKTAGVLRHKDTNEIYYLLVKKATIHADENVLPSKGALLEAANNAMESIL
jgi:hypothetical protein